MAESFSLRPLATVLKQESPARLMQQQATIADLGRQITHLLLTKPSGENLLPLVAAAVGEAFEVDCCMVTSHQQVQGEGPDTYWYTSNSKAALSREEISRLEYLTLGEMGASTDFLEISEANGEKTEQLRGEDGLQLLVRAVLGIATRFQGQVNGGIVIMRLEPYCWTAIEMEQLKVVSDQVAIAISHVVQTRALAASQQQIRALAQHQNLVHNLTMAIHRWGGQEQILQLAIDSLTDALQVEQGAILLLKYTDPLFKSRIGYSRAPEGSDPTSEQSKAFIPRAKASVVCERNATEQKEIEDVVGSPVPGTVREETTGTRVNPSFWLSECAWCQQAFTSAPKAVAIANASELVKFNPTLEIAPIFNPDVMPAVLLVPLVGASSGTANQGTILGFLVLQHSSPRLWQPEELRLVELVAAQLSTAILQTQTIQQVQALVEERNAQLQRSLEVQAKLYEKTRQQVEQLRRLNQLKDEFLSTLSHELNTPLTSMKLAIQILRQPGVPPERQSKYLDILEAEWNRESNLVNDLLKLQELESNSSSIKLQMVDLKLVLRKLADSFDQRWRDKGLTLAVDLPKKGLRIQTDPDSLDRILLELATNAGKYSAPGTTVSLRVSHDVDRNNNNTNVVLLTLTNTGAGISPADLPHIFDKFRRGQGVTQQAIAGTGLGLALVKCLVQHLNGSITVSSRPLGDIETVGGASTPWETSFTVQLNLLKPDRT